MSAALTALKFIWANYSDLIALYGGIKDVLAVVLKVLKENRPIIDKIAKETGVTVQKAEQVVLKAKIVPKRMSREEEEAWFQRVSGDGQF